jgi:hypothetical protein
MEISRIEYPMQSCNVAKDRKFGSSFLSEWTATTSGYPVPVGTNMIVERYFALIFFTSYNPAFLQFIPPPPLLILIPILLFFSYNFLTPFLHPHSFSISPPLRPYLFFLFQRIQIDRPRSNLSSRAYSSSNILQGVCRKYQYGVSRVPG